MNKNSWHRGPNGWLLTLVLIALCFVPALPAQEQKKRPPNLVIVLADDMGFGDPGCYNPQSKIATPYIDKLAAHIDAKKFDANYYFNLRFFADMYPYARQVQQASTHAARCCSALR